MPPKKRFITCEICGDRSSRRDSTKRMFMAKFPLDEARCRQWVKFVGKEDLIYVPIEKLHTLKYVCCKHFYDKAFNKKKNRLKRSAVPLKDLKADPLPDEMLLEFPLHIASNADGKTDNEAILSQIEATDKSASLHDHSPKVVQKEKSDTPNIDAPKVKLKTECVALKTGRNMKTVVTQESTASGSSDNENEHTDLNRDDDGDDTPWNTVAIVKGTSFTVKNYIRDRNLDLSKLTVESLPELGGLPTESLEPNTVYKVRVACVNSLGRGDWSEECEVTTCPPERPKAPTAVKVSKCEEGACLSWQPAPFGPEGIFEFSVYLAVGVNSFGTETSQLAFERVYCGHDNSCIVSHSSLDRAYLDASTKPGVVFRIAARSEVGYGYATQLCWLQGAKRNKPADSLNQVPSRKISNHHLPELEAT